MKVTREDADLFVSRLRKTSPAKCLPQIKDGQERKIVNFKNKCAASKTIKDLPSLLANPQDHWFKGEIEGMGGRIKKSSASYFRLQAFVSTMATETVNEIDKPSEPAGEYV